MGKGVGGGCGRAGERYLTGRVGGAGVELTLCKALTTLTHIGGSVRCPMAPPAHYASCPPFNVQGGCMIRKAGYLGMRGAMCWKGGGRGGGR